MGSCEHPVKISGFAGNRRSFVIMDKDLVLHESFIFLPLGGSCRYKEEFRNHAKNYSNSAGGAAAGLHWQSEHLPPTPPRLPWNPLPPF